MPISMSQSARYVTQSSIYSSPMLGRLTDRRIAKYQKQGYFSGGIVIREMKQKAKKLTLTQPKQVVISKKQQIKSELAKLLDL